MGRDGTAGDLRNELQYHHPVPSHRIIDFIFVHVSFRYEVQDLRVTDILPQMVALSESFFQVYELKGAK